MVLAKRAAYSVSSFSSGRALLEAADGFDVIFLDIQMEEPDGMETKSHEMFFIGETVLIK